MNVRRVLLIVFGVGAVCGYALLPLAGMRSVPGGPASPLFGVAGMLVTVSALGALITGFKQAEAQNRDPGLWAFAAFLLPCLVPFVLASRQRVTFDPGRSARRKIRVAGDELVVRTGLFRRVRLPLAGLRLLTLSAPAGESRWKWKPTLGPLAFESRRGIEFHELDLMSDADARALLAHYLRVFEELKDKRGSLLPDRKRLEVMALAKLHLAGYDSTEVQITFKDILCATDDVLAALEMARRRRIERLKAWLATQPEIVLGTGLTKSTRVAVSGAGIRRGTDVLPWRGVKSVGITEGRIEVELREPPSRWVRTWSIPVAKKSTLTAAAHFFFWLHLETAAHPDALDAGQHDRLAALLDGKAVCTGCNTVQEVTAGGLSACCQKLELRFRRADRNQKCSGCGTGLSDQAFGVETQLGDLIASHGFVCSVCGLGNCLGCTTKDASGEPAFTCACNAPLAIRL
jgi:hypothetical protein